MPYRIAAENEYARLEAEEIRRDVLAMRRTSHTDVLRLATIGLVILTAAWFGYGTFHRHPDVSDAHGVTDPPATCEQVVTVSLDGHSGERVECAPRLR